MAITYKDSGVDIKKGEALVEDIKKKVQRTYGSRVYAGVGGFSCLYEITPDKLLAAGTDGVGTKLKIAQKLNIHNTIGIDLVAMCVNDILCTGATPLFFMDYLACGKLDLEVSNEILEGIIFGCELCEMALIGGETAEMPGMYQNGDYDLAGFCVGEVLKSDLIDGSNIGESDVIIGIAASGLHSNGFSLARQLIKDDEIDILKQALTPTRIYSDLFKSLKENNLLNKISGIAHITGGGHHNIARINTRYDYIVNNWPDYKQLASINSIYEVMATRSGADREELHKTFNMGVGLVLITSNAKAICDQLDKLGETYWELGVVKKGSGLVSLS